MTWREEAAPIIRAVIAAHPGATRKEIMQALVRAYPFGPKRDYPYKIWRLEIRLQLGIDTRKLRNVRPSQRDPVPPEQGALFESEAED